MKLKGYKIYQKMLSLNFPYGGLEWDNFKWMSKKLKEQNRDIVKKRLP